MLEKKYCLPMKRVCCRLLPLRTRKLCISSRSSLAIFEFSVLESYSNPIIRYIQRSSNWVATRFIPIRNSEHAMAALNRRICWLVPVVAILLYLVPVLQGVPVQQDSEASSDQVSEPAKTQLGRLVKVNLPIDGRSASTVRQALSQIADDSKTAVRKEDRPVVVLEFDTSRGANGKGSTLGACFDLARFLGSSEMSRVKTVAFITGPNPTSAKASKLDETAKTQLVGHAVLVALATDEIAMHPNAQIGAAGIDEANVDDFVRQAYENIVAKGLTVPVPVAMAMLDKKSSLYRVSNGDGTVYVGQEELEKLEAKDDAPVSKTLNGSGVLAEFTGQQLVDFGLLRNTTSSRVELARRLGISPDSLKAELNRGEPWQAVRIEFSGFIDETSIQWISRSLEPKIASKQANLIILEIDSTSGDPDACLVMARRLSALDPDEFRTVAYISGEAAGPAAMLALSCQDVIMKTDAKIGGQFVPEIDAEKLGDIKTAATGIAETLGRDPALLQSVLDPSLEVFRYRNKVTGKERLFTQSQHDALLDADNWLQQSPHEVLEPMNTEAAEKIQLPRQVVASLDELKSFYQLDDEPELLKPTDVDRWLHDAALFLASPFVAPWLLFMAMFLLFNEVSSPGLGVPGFLGTVCLILYFWSQHFDGNANWLEILLFAAGVLFLLIELFVVPGVGIFGIGGLLMVVISIVLASQTFIFPTTNEEFRQLPRSLFALAGAFGGVLGGMLVLRTVLPKTPFFRRLMLEPPARDPDKLDDGTDPESMVNWNHLVGRRGTAITNLVPAGKARIDGQLMDVISDGRLIEKDQQLEVSEVAGNRIVVKAIASAQT